MCEKTNTLSTGTNVVSLDTPSQRNEQLVINVLTDAVRTERLLKRLSDLELHSLTDAEDMDKLEGYGIAFKLLGINFREYEHLLDQLGSIFWDKFNLDLPVCEVVNTIYVSWNAAIREFIRKEAA